MEQFETRKRKRRNPRGMLTVGEAAQRVGLSANAVLWNIRQQYLRAQYDGYRYWIHPVDLEEFRRTFYA